MCNGTWRSSTWIDYFYWDGSQAVFYGENYVAVDHSMMFWDCEFWWDEHTSEWHALFDCF